MAESDSGSKESQWAAWIEQQRETLRQQGKANGNGAAPGLNDQWRSLGDAWLGGLAELSRKQSTSGPGSVDETVAPFKVGEELLEVWRTAGVTMDAARQQATTALVDLLGRLPPLGLTREHARTWRDLAAAQAESQRLEQELHAVLLRVQGDALNLLERRVRELEKKQQPIASYRDLYNLWVECAEQVYSKVAQSDAYSRLQAQLGNASMRLRAHQQKIIEHALRQFDLPTRSEINSVHLQLRELKQKVALLERSETPRAAVRKRPAAKKSPKTRGQAGKRRGRTR